MSCLYTIDKIDELGAVRPRFMRNLTGKRANLTSNFPQIPAPVIHWSVIRLADIGWTRPTLHVTHWAKLSRGQAGQLLDNQSIPFLVCGTPCSAFVFLVDLHRQTFAIYILFYSSHISQTSPYIFIRMLSSLYFNNYLTLNLSFMWKDLTFISRCYSIFIKHKSVKSQNRSADKVLKA